MTSNILLVFGGVGLFLLGMLVLTDGLRLLAGNTMRRALARFTTSVYSGAFTGALTTAAVQSSSATIVSTVGFVSAGLLTFSQALGIILGANIGTTVTGWMVAILGFKLKLGIVVLPLLLVGVLLKMFGTRRLSNFGWAITGFSLLFIGIDAMQRGMGFFEGMLTPNDFPDDTILGRIQLVFIGMAITVITQSSSAGVATSLVALDAGAISFAQAAALVIGMDVGTSFKSALATIGGSTATRRTGYAHVIYNIMTGVMACFMLAPFSAIAAPWIASVGGNSQIALVAFHTMFNTIGVLLILPFTQPFAQMIIELVPERGPRLTRRLDGRLLKEPAAAIDALLATINDISIEQFNLLANLLKPALTERIYETNLQSINDALGAARIFMEQVRVGPTDQVNLRRLLSCMHALDHLRRFNNRCGQIERIRSLQSEARLVRLSKLLQGSVNLILQSQEPAVLRKRLDRLRRLLRDQRRSYRDRVMRAMSCHQIDGDTALMRLDGIRWLHRVSYHVWRIVYHLHVAHGGEECELENDEVLLDIDDD